jgi:hypothetical protein
MGNANELYDKVDAIIKEHGLLTGDEFIALADTYTGSPLHWAYITYWNTIIMTDVYENIDRKLGLLDG